MSDGDSKTVVGFRTAYVFDAEQTDGAALSEPAQASGDPGAKTASLEAAIIAKGSAIERVGSRIYRFVARRDTW